jgi:hypothetical protein
MTLTSEEQERFENAIDATIIARYNGDLERHEDPRGKRGDFYTPLDTNNIRELLIELWGERLTANAIEDAFLRLTEDGAESWPHGWCDDDIAEDEAVRFARGLDAEEEANQVA